MTRILRGLLVVIAAVLVAMSSADADELRGTGNLGVIIERASGSVVVVDVGRHEIIGRVNGLGDLSHASAVFSPD